MLLPSSLKSLRVQWLARDFLKEAYRSGLLSSTSVGDQLENILACAGLEVKSTGGRHDDIFQTKLFSRDGGEWCLLSLTQPNKLDERRGSLFMPLIVPGQDQLVLIPV